MKTKFSRIHTLWRRRAITAYLRCLLLLGILSSPRSRVHWLGHYRRPRRFERRFFFLLIFGAMLLLEPRDYLFWSILWGGTLAIFINLYTIYLLIPRKSEHIGSSHE